MYESDKGKILRKLIELGIVNAEDLHEEVMRTDSAKHVYYYAASVNNFDEATVNKLIDKFILTKGYLLDSDISKYLYLFALYVDNAPIDRLQKLIIQYGFLYDILSFARDIKGANINLLANEVIKYSNADKSNIVYFIEGVKDAPIDILYDVIINSNDQKSILNIAKYNYENQNDSILLDKLTNAIIRTNSASYIYKFACTIKNANIKLLMYKLFSLSEYEYLDKLKHLYFANNEVNINELSDDKKIKYLRDNVLLEDISLIMENKDLFRNLFITPKTKKLTK